MQDRPRIITKIEANPMLSTKRNEFRQLKVAAYCRVSTDSEDQVESYKAQVAYYTDGISGRERLFEAKQQVQKANNERRRKAPNRKLEGSS